MEFKLYYLFVVALVPMVIGAIWYSDKVFGKTWMNVAGINAETLKKGNMVGILLVTYILSVFLSFGLTGVCIHQFSVFSLFAAQEGFGKEGTEIMNQFEQIQDQFKDVHRHFGHGALHGIFAGISFGLGILGINALFERKSFKYILINSLYWVVTMGLMGGLLTVLL